ACPRPERLQYAELSESSREMQSFPVGSQISFVCRPGYMRAPGMSLTQTCGADLQWSPTGVFCTERKCQHPGDLQNGYIDGTDLTFGSKLTFSCKEGYRLRGNEEISCVIKNEGVGWSGNLPYCEIIPCEPPPKIANGDYEERGSYVYQSSVTYRCQDVPRGRDPFSLIGPHTIHCTADANSNGVWSGPPPECRVVKCENPSVENGRKASGFGPSYSYKDSVVFECNQGYFMVGAGVITCEGNNTWVPPKPTCEKSKTFYVCPAPKIPNGVLTPDKPAYGQGESVQVRCNRGCSFPGGSEEVTVTCQEQGSWGALQHCTCKPQGSGSTPVISYGRVTAGRKPSYSVGDFITIECYTGYTLHGEAQIQYDGNKWVPAVPTCQLSGYIIAIICVIVVVVVLLAAFWIYKKFFSQNGKRESTPSSAEYKMCKA
ncbi:C4BPA protein, partial [Cnemophilus loriae]|nr:C4BPA protein [Cnemophilus loriae]